MVIQGEIVDVTLLVWRPVFVRSQAVKIALVARTVFNDRSNENITYVQ